MKCLTPACKKDAASADFRGLCVSCYSAAKKLVEACKTSWENLEAMGLIAPKISPFEAEFLKRTKL